MRKRFGPGTLGFPLEGWPVYRDAEENLTQIGADFTDFAAYFRKRPGRPWRGGA